MNVHHHTGLRGGVFLTLIIWGVHLLGGFALLQGVTLDLFVRLTPPQTKAPDTLLLIEADAADQGRGDEVWLTLLKRLEGAGATQILFAFLPDASDAFYAHAEKNPQVLFGRPLVEGDEGPRLADLPGPLRKPPRNLGVTALPVPFYGINRTFRPLLPTPEGEQPALVLLAATERRGHRPQAANPFVINFIRRPADLPRIALTTALSPNLVPELVANRSVLIGFSLPPGTPGLATPLARPLSPLSYQGYAFLSLLEEKTVRPAGPAATLFAVALVCVVTATACQLLGTLSALIFTVALVATMAAMAWATVFLLAFFPPLVEGVSASALLFLMITVQKTQATERATHQLLLSKSLRLREKIFPKSFFDTDEYWPQIINMVKQTLSLSRTLFLESLTDDHRVREVIALNCSIDDISEKRRDYERTPYLTAIDAGHPIEVVRFLAHTTEAESQYLVPLIFAEKILGFWAFGIDKTQVPDLAAFLSSVGDFSREISEMLYRRQARKAQQHQEDTLVSRLFNLTATDAHLEITRLISYMERRLVILESVFNGIGTATILYDLFGRVIQINRRMSDLLALLKIAPYDMTALDLLVTLSGRDVETLRTRLNQVIVHRESFQLPIHLPQQIHKHHTLIIRPLARDEVIPGDEPDAFPFHMYGIIFDLSDVSGVKSAFQAQDHLEAWANRHLYNDMQAILTASALRETPAWERCGEAIAETIRRRILTMSRSHEIVREFLDSADLLTEPPAFFPIHPCDPVREAVEALAPLAAKHQVRLIVHDSPFLGLMLAGPDLLVALLTEYLTTLLRDIPPGGTLTLSVAAQESTISYTLTHTGFGMPAPLFHRNLFDENGEGFQGLRRYAAVLKGWGGCLDGHSEVGKGTQITLFFLKLLPEMALPAAAGGPRPPQAPSGPPDPALPLPDPPIAPGTTGRRVLLIDDDRVFLSLLARLPLFAADTVVLAENGERGWEALTAARPDLVLIDLFMPRMDGMAFLARLKEAGIALPVVVMTGARGKTLEADLMLAGARAVLFKPFDPEALARALGALEA